MLSFSGTVLFARSECFSEARQIKSMKWRSRKDQDTSIEISGGQWQTWGCLLNLKACKFIFVFSTTIRWPNQTLCSWIWLKLLCRGNSEPYSQGEFMQTTDFADVSCFKSECSSSVSVSLARFDGSWRRTSLHSAVRIPADCLLVRTNATHLT